MTDVYEARRKVLERLDALCVERAWRLACTMLHDAGDADDAVQEAYVAAARNYTRVPNDDPWPWFAKVIANMCRRRRRARGRQGHELVHEMVDVSRDPLAAAIRAELQTELRKALGELPNDERDAVVLVYAAGLSQIEAAEAAGLPRTTLAHRAERGMDRLRRSLGASTETTGSLLGVALVAPPSGGLNSAREIWKASALKAGTGASIAALVGGLSGGVVMGKQGMTVVAVTLLLLIGGGVWYVAGPATPAERESATSHATATINAPRRKGTSTKERNTRPVPPLSKPVHEPAESPSTESAPLPDNASSTDVCGTVSDPHEAAGTVPPSDKPEQPFATVRGRVVDEAGQGIGDVKIALKSMWNRLQKRSRIDLVAVQHVAKGTAQSLSDGTFTLDILLPIGQRKSPDELGWQFLLCTSHRDFYSHTSPAWYISEAGVLRDHRETVIDVLTLVMTNGDRTLRGRVLSAIDGVSPVAGAWVTIDGGADANDGGSKNATLGPLSTQTNAQGEYEFTHLPASRYELTASHLQAKPDATGSSLSFGDYARPQGGLLCTVSKKAQEYRHTEVQTIKQSLTVAQDLRLWPSSELSFRVSTLSEQTLASPPSHGEVVVRTVGVQYPTIFVRPDPLGIYRIRDIVHPEIVSLQIFVRGFRPLEISLPQISVAEMSLNNTGIQQYDLGTIALDCGATISGQLKSSIGAPLSGIEVGFDSPDLRASRSGIWLRVFFPVITDAEGRYAISGLPEGTYTLTLTPKDCASITRTVTLDGPNAHVIADILDVPKGSTITGRVVREDFDMRSLPINLHLCVADQGGLFHFYNSIAEARPDAVANADGTYRVAEYGNSKLGSGHYRIFASCGNLFTLSNPFELDGQQDIIQDLVIEQGGSLAGRITVLNGASPADLGIGIRSPKIDSGNGNFLVETRTGQEGDYRIECLSPGEYSLFVFRSFGFDEDFLLPPRIITVVKHQETRVNLP